jgi:hypothetical protein
LFKGDCYPNLQSFKVEKMRSQFNSISDRVVDFGYACSFGTVWKFHMIFDS